MVLKLDPKMLRKLSAFLEKPKTCDPYAEICSVLCKRYKPTMEQKLDELLASTDLGDDRPAEYTMELRCLLANAGTEDILKQIFLRSLPKTIIRCHFRGFGEFF